MTKIFIVIVSFQLFRLYIKQVKDNILTEAMNFFMVHVMLRNYGSTRIMKAEAFTPNIGFYIF